MSKCVVLVWRVVLAQFAVPAKRVVLVMFAVLARPGAPVAEAGLAGLVLRLLGESDREGVALADGAEVQLRDCGDEWILVGEALASRQFSVRIFGFWFLAGGAKVRDTLVAGCLLLLLERRVALCECVFWVLWALLVARGCYAAVLLCVGGLVCCRMRFWRVLAVFVVGGLSGPRRVIALAAGALRPEADAAAVARQSADNEQIRAALISVLL